MSKIRILLADDHQMFRTGIANLLKNEADFEIAGEASDGIETIQLANRLNPDVILMDIGLPLLDGIAATQKIIAGNKDAKILALTSVEDDEHIINMVRAGANGYILKEAPIEELVLAVRTIANGSSYFTKEISGKLFAHLEYPDDFTPDKTEAKRLSITGREMEVLKLISGELTTKEIAARLFISPRTVETHRRNLIQKIQVKNTAGLVKFYLHLMEHDSVLNDSN